MALIEHLEQIARAGSKLSDQTFIKLPEDVQEALNIITVFIKEKTKPNSQFSLQDAQNSLKTLKYWIEENG